MLAMCACSLPMFRGPRWLKSAFARLARAARPPPRWQWTRLDGTSLVIGTVPQEDAHMRELYNDGVRAVVSLNMRWEPQVEGGLAAACKRAGLRHLALPTPDYSAPSLSDVRRAVAFITEHAAKGGVYVHCNAGRGRSAVCLLAYLMEAHGLSAVSAYQLVAAQRKITKLPSRLLGFRRPQWHTLLRFETELAGRGTPRADS